MGNGRGYGRFRHESYFRSVDALRALSIVGVIAYHTNVPLPGLFGRQGFLGVTLFFVISGFLITTLLLREQDEAGTISLKNFYARRTLRIFPLYYATLAMFCALTFAFDRHTPEGQEFWRHLPSFIVYMNNWVIALGPARVIFAFSWSLATEEQFYLIWPWVVAFSRGRRWLALGAITLLMFVTWTMRSLIGNHVVELDDIGDRVATSVAPGICAGCILAFVLHNPRGYRIVARVLAWRASSLVALAAVVVGAALPGGDLLLIAMVALLASVVVQPDHLLRPVFENVVVREIGKVSYGMYLLFTLVINVGRRVLHLRTPWMQFPWTLLATAILSALVYKYYETPFLRMRKRFPRARAAQLDSGRLERTSPDIAKRRAAGAD
jgi:peptidoglycan/LPS O-acetylase OafA/YrhL